MAKKAENKADTLGNPEELMAAIVLLTSQMKDLPTTIGEKVNAVIDAMLLAAIRGC